MCGMMPVMPSNRYFSADMLQTLLATSRWRLVHAAPLGEAKPVSDPKHVRWQRSNSHLHPHQEIMIPLIGSGVYGHSGQTYAAVPGTVFFFDSFTEHDSGYPPGSPPVEQLWINLVDDRVIAHRIGSENGRYSERVEMNCLISQEEIGIDLQRTFEACRSDKERAPELARTRLRGAIAAIVAAIIEDGYKAPEAERALSFQAKTIEAICQHITSTCGRGVTIDQLAHIAGYSKFHFVRMFKKHAGTTVHQFVDRSRMSKVKEMRKAGRTFKEIAADLKFSCPSAFSRWYRRQVPTDSKLR